MKLLPLLFIVILLSIGGVIFAETSNEYPERFSEFVSVDSLASLPIVNSTALLPIGFEVEPMIRKLIECESGWDDEAIGDDGKAYGLLQFWEGTFNQFKNMYDMEWLEYRNSQHQVILATVMVKDGYGGHWTCYDKDNTINQIVRRTERSSVGKD